MAYKPNTLSPLLLHTYSYIHVHDTPILCNIPTAVPSKHHGTFRACVTPAWRVNLWSTCALHRGHPKARAAAASLSGCENASYREWEASRGSRLRDSGGMFLFNFVGKFYKLRFNTTGNLNIAVHLSIRCFSARQVAGRRGLVLGACASMLAPALARAATLQDVTPAVAPAGTLPPRCEPITQMACGPLPVSSHRCRYLQSQLTLLCVPRY